MNTPEELISTAKAKLMDAYGINEEQAHHFILHTAMHTRRTKISVAKQLIKLERI